MVSGVAVAASKELLENMFKRPNEVNFGIEKFIQSFFDKIANTIGQYKILKKDETRRLKLEKIEKNIECYSWQSAD